jgi:hypothetical protein
MNERTQRARFKQSNSPRSMPIQGPFPASPPLNLTASYAIFVTECFSSDGRGRHASVAHKSSNVRDANAVILMAYL